jgi:hypothetical protein
MNELVVYWTSASLIAFSVLFFLGTFTKIHLSKVLSAVIYMGGFVWVLGLVYIFYR